MLRTIFCPVLSFICIALLLCFSETALAGARYGFYLWYKTLFPTLMPFMVLSNFIVLTGSAKSVGKLLLPLTRLLKLPPSSGYCILVGLLCGYPMGAYICCSLNCRGELSDEELNYLAPVCNNVSPMFMISYIARSCLKVSHAVIDIPLILIGGSILGMILLRLPVLAGHKAAKSGSSKERGETPQTDSLSVGQAINQSINNTINACLKLCIYVMLFSITGSMIGGFAYLPDTAKAGLMSLCEITAGLDRLATIDISYYSKVLYTTVLTAFGGLSSVFQTVSLGVGSKLSPAIYIKNKLIIAGITGLLALIIMSTR